MIFVAAAVVVFGIAYLWSMNDVVPDVDPDSFAPGEGIIEVDADEEVK